MIRCVLLAACLVAAFIPGGQTLASTPCSLVQISSLPLDTHVNGEVSVPASLNGKQVMLTIDTGSVMSSISFGAAKSLGLPLNISGRFYEFVNGVTMFFYVKTDTFALGSATGSGMQFLIAPSHMLLGGTSGLLGQDILKQFDVELDFVAGKFNVFAPNTCPSAPVYWTREPFADVAMTIDRDWHINVPALLDGRPITVSLDTGAPGSFMNFDASKKIFGWQENDPNLKSSTTTLNGKVATVYRYRFSTLVIDGIEVAWPSIDMMPQKNFGPTRDDDPELVLGMSILRQLHLYIGYKAQKLYLTAAEAH